MAEQPETIVLVEDEPSQAMLARAAIERSGLGCRVEECVTAAAGLERLRRGGVRLLLAGYSLPDMNGLELLEAVQREGHGVPVVILNNSGNEELACQTIRAGAADYVIKSPEAFDALPRRLERVLGEWDAKRRSGQTESIRRESERRYRALFEDSRDAVFVSTPDGRLVDINPAGVQMFGYSSKEDLLKGHLPDDLYADRRERDRVERLLAEQGFVQDHELRLRRRDGREVIVQETATAVRDDDGQVVVYHGILRDVTQQRGLEEQLRQAQKMEAVGTLAGGLAHDFNNLLTAILGNAELARSSLAEGDRAQAALANIEAAARQASEVARSLLTFSHRRSTPAHKAPVGIARVVADSTRLLRRLLPASIELAEDVPTGAPWWVQADATQLQQVLMNLAVNARDAMPDGGRLRIGIEAKSLRQSGLAPAYGGPDLPGVIMVVEDTGMGMSQEVRARIFEPFFTTKPRGQGTGLGLSTTYAIVTDHKGYIQVESEVGAGTRITIWLPSCDPRAEADAAEREAARAVTGHGELVVLAEHDRQVRAILASALKLAGYKVIQVADGAAAMAAIAAHRDDVRLVVLDLELPKKPGLTCLEQARGLGVNAPAVMLAGGVGFESEGTLGENDHLLRKPFRTSELLELAARVTAVPQRAETA